MGILVGEVTEAELLNGGDGQVLSILLSFRFLFTFFPTMNCQVLGGKTAHASSALVLMGGGEGG